MPIKTALLNRLDRQFKGMDPVTIEVKWGTEWVDVHLGIKHPQIGSGTVSCRFSVGVFLGDHIEDAVAMGMLKGVEDCARAHGYFA